MSHYFTHDPDLADRPVKFSYGFKGKPHTFHSDSGVFSAQKLDGATDILLQNIPPLTGSLLDLGCGYGAVGIVLAKAYNLALTQADINPKAVALTRRNCAENGVVSNVLLSDCFENIAGSFDTVALNPPIHAGKNVVYAMFAGSREHLNDGGSLYVVIQKKHGAESAVAELRRVFGGCEVVYKKKGVFVLRCRR